MTTTTDVLEAADALAAAGEAYYRGMDACHQWGMSEGEGDPPPCACDANAEAWRAALEAFKVARNK